jgi:hypothetical protein
MALIHAFSLSQNFSFPHNLPKYPIKRSPLPDHKYGKFRRFASIPTSHLQVERQSANYQPSFWSYDFLQSLNSDYAVTMHIFLQLQRDLFPLNPPPLISLF